MRLQNTSHTAAHGAEPTLSEMLADPIVQAIMACDGVTRGKVERLIQRVGRRQIGLRTEPGRMDRQVSAATAFGE